MLSRKLFELNWCAGSVLTLRGTQNVRFVSNDPPEIPNEGKSERKPKWEQFATKDEMHRWRTQPNAWKSKIGIFKISEPKVQVLEFMASRKGKLMEMWRARHEIGERQAQVYDSRRQVHFGHELGCAHFFAYRNARIK